MRNKPYLQLGRGLAVPFTETMHHLSHADWALKLLANQSMDFSSCHQPACAFI
jgi:hypothetical protein